MLIINFVSGCYLKNSGKRITWVIRNNMVVSADSIGEADLVAVFYHSARP